MPSAAIVAFAARSGRTHWQAATKVFTLSAMRMVSRGAE